MSDAIRPTGDSNTERKENERRATDASADKTTEQRDAEKASRESATGTTATGTTGTGTTATTGTGTTGTGTAGTASTRPFDTKSGDRSGDSRTADDKSALRGTGSDKEKATPLGSDRTDRTDRTDRSDRTDRTDRSDRTAAATATSDRAIPSPREGDPTTPSRERTRTEQSTPTVHAPEAAPAVGSGNGRRVPQDAENGSLLPHDESDKFSLRLQHAVTGFVDEPRSAVEEADHVLEEVAARFTEAVTKRRATLHGSWESKGSDGADDTEQLRLALRDYRELTERLLHM
ncbi:hypothetical protein [Streptomyces sp. NPDC088847]|uniref:hypothetical protein n=1 Tax=Streptomyces sp. NPDC088847 TaxID=3365909 RepID=UPI0037F883A0